MRIQTKYFGAVELAEEDVLFFPDGLFGFEEEKKFVLLPFSGEDDCLLCLQSVQTPLLAFATLNPFFFWSDYRPCPTPEDLERLEVKQSESLCYYAMCVVRDPLVNTTVNLRCPVAINPDTRQARQVMLDSYDMRTPLPTNDKNAAPTSPSGVSSRSNAPSRPDTSSRSGVSPRANASSTGGGAHRPSSDPKGGASAC